MRNEDESSVWESINIFGGRKMQNISKLYSIVGLIKCNTLQKDSHCSQPNS